MPACTRPNAIATDRSLVFALCAVLACGLFQISAPAIGAGFTVNTVQPRAVGKILQLKGSVDLTLTPKVEEAIGKGIPIQLVIELRVYRQRPLIWDKQVENWTLRRELSYHALSGQYLIGAVSAVPADRESFTALNEALTELGALDDVTLSMDAPLATDAKYHLDVRAWLDIEALPPLLRPIAYTSSDWNLKSEWSAWTIQR